MKRESEKKSSVVLLTGGAGFLGKVVLEDLLRRQEELGFEKVALIIRSKKGKTAKERFEETISRSECFRCLPSDWVKKVEVLCGDLAEPGWDLPCGLYERLAAQVTHIVHCAASVDFNLPIISAAKANITSTLSVLDFARTCPGIQRFVSVSTAYVTPHRAGPIEESLVPLPIDAEKFYQDICSGAIGQEEALAKVGLPNTYTLTKCIAEHLLIMKRGRVPLTIVRPSIVAVAERHPFPGWLDSYAGLAGYLASIGAGYLRVAGGNPDTRLDVVPVDHVARTTVNHAFFPDRAREVPIVHSVSGMANALPVGMLVKETASYFNKYAQGRKARVRLGPIDKSRQLEHLIYTRGPIKLAQVGAKLTGNKLRRRQARQLDRRLDATFTIFNYFSHNTFDFVRSLDEGPVPSPEEYIFLFCKGIHRHLFRQDPHRQVLAGSKTRAKGGFLSRAFAPTRGNESIRAAAFLLKKTFDRLFLEVSYDQQSFESALAVKRDSDQVVVIPTHRSYVDFLVCSYLFFMKPDLGIDVPEIAAAEEFAGIPVLGLLFKRMGAFYLKRGTGQEDPGLTKKIDELVESGKTIQFFIEGKRSRSRHFLPPKRGMLRALQKSAQRTGKTFIILPVSISYDRIPEEATILNQMKGMRKEPMRLDRLFQWTHRLMKTDRTLGNVHIRCGNPVRLEPASDVPAVSRDIMNELQRSMVVSSYHLECFLKANPKLILKPDVLIRALEQRGASVSRSRLHERNISVLDSTLERSFRMQWIHFFIPDVLNRHPDNQALRSYAKANLYLKPGNNLASPEIDSLLRLLFEPICRDYENVAKAAWAAFEKGVQYSRSQILHLAAYLDRPTAEQALNALIQENLLREDGVDSLSLAAGAELWGDYIRGCRW